MFSPSAKIKVRSNWFEGWKQIQYMNVCLRSPEAWNAKLDYAQYTTTNFPIQFQYVNLPRDLWLKQQPNRPSGINSLTLTAHYISTCFSARGITSVEILKVITLCLQPTLTGSECMPQRTPLNETNFFFCMLCHINVNLNWGSWEKS